MTSIEWTDRVWNPVRGCSLVSKGCEACYAMKQAHRFSGEGMPYAGLTKLTSRGPTWTGAARFVPDTLLHPLRWKKPTRVFVNSMSDLWHDDVTNEEIAAVFAVMAMCPQHTFQILTKRPLRMRQWFDWVKDQADGQEYGLLHSHIGALHSTLFPGAEDIDGGTPFDRAVEQMMGAEWPLPNVHLGVSVENQDVITGKTGRIFHLIDVPAAVRFLSIEPMLGPVDLTRIEMFREGGDDGKDPHMPGVHYDALRSLFIEPDELHETPIDWVIVGGESGPGARPCDVEWIRSIVKQCARAGVPCFVKQLGGHVFAPWKLAWAERMDGSLDAHSPDRVGVKGSNFATVWPNGTWHTWDANGVGGENSSSLTVAKAKHKAIEALARQHVSPIKGWQRFPHMLVDRKGGDPGEWPEDLRVRQFPERAT